MTKTKTLASLAGMALVGVYLLGAILAFSRYPAPYSPVANWLSDLGSPVLNPMGAGFYNGGIVLTGIFVFLFFAGLSGARIVDNKKQHIMLYLSRGFGAAGAFSIVMSGFYPINLPGLHGFWSIALYVTLGTSFVFTVAAFRYHRSWPRWLLVIGLIVALVDIVSGVFGQYRIFEWVTVSLFLFYVFAVSSALRRLP
jgi:hypothetical membrane protein